MKTASVLIRSVIMASGLLGVTVARADLMLFPTRVVIAGNQRAAQVELVNRGTAPETYRITLVNRRMTETGEIIEAKDRAEAELFADELIRYSPRQVTLQPGIAQTVRITVRKPADLGAGEYRSHLQFDRVPDAEGASDLESLARPEAGQLAVVVRALVGASIPVIVRHGDPRATVVLENLALDAAGQSPQLRFSIERRGNSSVYGDFVAVFVPRTGKAVEVGKVDGVAVYTPNATRRASMPLTVPPGTMLRDGVITLSYTERPEAGRAVLAQASLPL